MTVNDTRIEPCVVDVEIVGADGTAGAPDSQLVRAGSLGDLVGASRLPVGDGRVVGTNDLDAAVVEETKVEASGRHVSRQVDCEPLGRRQGERVLNLLARGRASQEPVVQVLGDRIRGEQDIVDAD